MNLLSPYRVLDLTSELGFLAGKIFGDLGAEVIKVEPPAGDCSRRRPPFLKKGNGAPQSLHWQAYNSNKLGVTLDLSQQKGRELFSVTDIDQEAVNRLEAPIAEFFFTLTKQEFLAGAMSREILGYPVATVEDIYADEQLRARQFWHEANDPDSGGTLKHPGGFAIFNGERLQIRELAPRIGQHNHDVYKNDLGLSEREIAQLKVEEVI